MSGDVKLPEQALCRPAEYCEILARMPDAVGAELPLDEAGQHDHQSYGVPKRARAAVFAEKFCSIALKLADWQGAGGAASASSHKLGEILDSFILNDFIELRRSGCNCGKIGHVPEFHAR